MTIVSHTWSLVFCLFLLCLSSLCCHSLPLPLLSASSHLTSAFSSLSLLFLSSLHSSCLFLSASFSPLTPYYTVYNTSPPPDYLLDPPGAFSHLFCWLQWTGKTHPFPLRGRSLRNPKNVQPISAPYGKTLTIHPPLSAIFFTFLQILLKFHKKFP